MSQRHGKLYSRSTPWSSSSLFSKPTMGDISPVLSQWDESILFRLYSEMVCWPMSPYVVVKRFWSPFHCSGATYYAWVHSFAQNSHTDGTCWSVMALANLANILTFMYVRYLYWISLSAEVYQQLARVCDHVHVQPFKFQILTVSVAHAEGLP